jgi:hypothetical protein
MSPFFTRREDFPCSTGQQSSGDIFREEFLEKSVGLGKFLSTALWPGLYLGQKLVRIRDQV